MSSRSVPLLLADMIERIQRIERFVAGLDHEGFLEHEATTDAVVRNLEVVGEAASRLPREFTERHAEIPWRQIVGLRHRIVHEYFDVDLELVWEIVRGELPGLKERLAALHREPTGGGEQEPS